ncbi:hypothetical protein DH2020_027295 [Rehmannia glutinosa]|uniref:Uncharacterized protein n=1 Tax=Rehmannia glutinosa TaxID=99300 RepID=A0ABR0VWE7_REHGL
METMNYGMRKKSRKTKKRGRRKGSKNKVNPEVTRKLGDATLHYAHGRFEEAICVLKEVIRLAPNLSDPYHTLALIYTAMSDKKRALNFYMIAAHLTRRILLCGNFLEQGDKKQANYCLSKAIIADPEDIGVQFHRAALYVELGEYLKAADSYEQISCLCPNNIEVLKSDTALEHIDRTQRKVYDRNENPLHPIIKAGICHVHLGHPEKARGLSTSAQVNKPLCQSPRYKPPQITHYLTQQTTLSYGPHHFGPMIGITKSAYFNVLKPENASTHPHLIIDVADSLTTVGHYESALKYYMMLEEDMEKYNVRNAKYTAETVEKLGDSVDARLTLSSLLLEENRDDEAISVLSPPVESESNLDTKPDAGKLWWRSGKIKLKLSQIYKAKGSFEAFVDALFPVIRETLFLETVKEKVKVRRRLSISVLSQRVKVLDDHQTDLGLSKASRAKKLLQKKTAVREARRAAALAAGIDWNSDDSDNESPQVFREPPLPDFLKEEGHHLLIVDLCKSLSSLRRYWEALEIINLCLKLECNILSVQTKEELRTLGAQISYNIADPAHGWDCVRYIVSRHPYSFSAWNCYFKGILRHNRLSRRNKFLHNMRVKHKDSVPPILITAHQFTMISQHQGAAREYLEAYKLMPENPLINLCVGTALVNLALGHRLQNKHQAVLQGLAFLYNNSRICGDSQEAFYNIARAYHHVGLVSLAATHYEKVLAIREKDYPIPILPNDNPDLMDSKKPGYCDLRREAAYNLQLIYKKSGAFDLARQVLKEHVVFNSGHGKPRPFGVSPTAVNSPAPAMNSDASQPQMEQQMHMPYTPDEGYRQVGSSPPLYQPIPAGATVIHHTVNFNSGDQKRKRGRPRRYGPDGSMAVSTASAQQPISVGMSQQQPQTFSPPAAAPPHPVQTEIPSGGSATPAVKKARGRPRGSSNKKQRRKL